MGTWRGSGLHRRVWRCDISVQECSRCTTTDSHWQRLARLQLELLISELVGIATTLPTGSVLARWPRHLRPEML